MKTLWHKAVRFCIAITRGSLPAKDGEPCHYCLVGNIVAEHELGEAKEIHSGTRHFTPGTKVYCLPPQWGDGYEKAIVVGLCRKSRRWITVVMPTKHITNWRAKPVYSPKVIRRLREGFDGFHSQWQSRKDVEKWAAALRKPGGSPS
jgi:hypothetical protein